MGERADAAVRRSPAAAGKELTSAAFHIARCYRCRVPHFRVAIAVLSRAAPSYRRRSVSAAALVAVALGGTVGGGMGRGWWRLARELLRLPTGGWRERPGARRLAVLLSRRFGGNPAVTWPGRWPRPPLFQARRRLAFDAEMK